MDGKKRKLQARDALIEQYQDYVESVAKRLIHTMRLPADQLEEFISAGYLGLVEAASRYEPKSGATFKQFAYLRIQGAIIDSIRESSDISGDGYRYAQALRAAIDIREDGLPSYRVSTTPEESLAHILEYAAKSAFAFRLSVSDVETELSVREPTSDPEQELMEREHSKTLKKIIRKLPRKERIIIEEYYLKGRSFSEIAESHRGLSKSWISRLHNRALSLLKDRYEIEIAKI